MLLIISLPFIDNNQEFLQKVQINRKSHSNAIASQRFLAINRHISDFWVSREVVKFHKFLKLISSPFSSIHRDIREALKRRVTELTKKLPNFRPGLAIVQVGGREDSNVYIRMKMKAAAEIGIHAEHIQLPKTITEGELLAKVRPDACQPRLFL